MTRQGTNLKIIELLTKLITANPELRFGQLLHNSNVIASLLGSDGSLTFRTELLNEESTTTLKNVIASKLYGSYILDIQN